MAVTSGFFNSVSGDRKYNAEQINEFFGGLISSGVLPNPSTNLQVVANSGMNVQVKAGKGYIDSHWVKNDNALDLTIDTADSILNRIDAVIMKLDENTSARTITVEVKKGTAASSPTAPTMERTTSIKEYCLATVYVGKAVTSISQSNITDTRANTDVCGWVTGLITQVDTSTLFTQWQTAYEEQMRDMKTWMNEQQEGFEMWLSALTGKLQVNTYIQQYRSIVSTETKVSEITIGISEYDPTTDILFANINGIVLVEEQDYTISGTGKSTKIVLNNAIDGDNVIEFRVLKSKIGQQTT